MIQLYLVRHGECEGSGTYIGRGSDVELTAQGSKQIHKLSKKLKSDFALHGFDNIYTSTMKRCLETTEIISEYLPSKINKINNIEEINFGDWEGKTYSDIQNSTYQRYNEWIEDPVNNQPPGGESLIDLKKRVMEFIPDIEVYINDDKVWNIAIISHKGPLSILLLYYLKLDLSFFWNFKIDRGSVSKLNLYSGFSQIEFLNIV